VSKLENRQDWGACVVVACTSRLSAAMSEADELRREIELLKRVLVSLDDADKSAEVLPAAAATGEAVDLAAELK
jgi:hypothetical protein